jgi:hypothetical protein
VFEQVPTLLGSAEPKQALSAKWRNEMHFRVFLYITNCGQIILEDWYRFQGGWNKTQGLMRELVGTMKISQNGNFSFAP